MTITNTDLHKELSEIELLQLSDLNGNGTLDQGVIDDAAADALAFIESFVLLPDTPTALLQKIGVDLTIYELRNKNGLVTDEMREERKTWESYLLKMSKGLLPTEKIGDATPAPASKKATFVHSRPRTDTTGLGMPE